MLDSWNSSCALPPAASAGTGAATFASALTHVLAAQCALREDWPEDSLNRVKDGDWFDFIVIGAGTAGSVVASRLVERTPWSVLLVEAGGDPPLESIVPHFSGQLHKGPGAWEYYTEDDGVNNRGTKNKRCYWPRGKMLGGSGSINGNVYARGNAEDFESWAKTVNDEEWSFKNVLEYFKKSENFVDSILNKHADRSYHGFDGPMIVDKLNFSYPFLAKVLKESYIKLGLKENKDYNGASQMGVGDLYGTIANGKKVSTATAYLNKVKDRENLYLLKNTFVKKIHIGSWSQVATGIDVVLSTGKNATFKVRREIILSAGAINTPQILMLSGIGPKDHLESLGIEVLIDRPVGENLQDHVRVPIPVTLNTGLQAPSQDELDLIVLEYLLKQKGILAQNADQPNLNVFMSYNDKQKYPDVQIDHNYFPIATSHLRNMCDDILGYNDEICDSLSNLNKHQDLLIYFVSLSRPDSKGKIFLRSTNPSDYPIIHANYFSDDRDMDIFVKNIKKLMTIIDTPILKSMNASIERVISKECNDYMLNSDDYWECMARTMTYTVYHYSGTAKMGTIEDPTSVVDSRLKIHDIEGLRIVDASIMPQITRANTNAAVVMIAEKASDFIINEHEELDKQIKVEQEHEEEENARRNEQTNNPSTETTQNLTKTEL